MPVLPQRSISGEGAPLGKAFALAPCQQKLWFLATLDPNNTAYLMTQCIHIKGRLDYDAVSWAVEQVIHRHRQLRIRFFVEEGEPRQAVGKPYPAEVELIDVAESFTGDLDRLWSTITPQFSIKPVDLTRDHMLRTTLLRLAEDEHVLCFTLHHIVADGWSLQILQRDFAAFYTAHLTGEEVLPRPVTAQYADYVDQVVARQQTAEFKTRLTQRAAMLGEASPLLELPVDSPYPDVLSFAGDLAVAVLPASLSEDLVRLSRELRVTPFMLHLAVYGIFLQKIAGQDDVLTAIPYAARDQKQFQTTFGYFVNTVAVRLDLRGNPTFAELLDRIKAEAIAVMSCQDLPLEMLIGEIRPQRVENRHPLVQTMFSYLGGLDMVPKLHGTETRLLLPPRNAAMFEMTVDIVDQADGLQIIFEYNTDIFKRTTIERFQTLYRLLLETLVADRKKHLAEMPNLATDRLHALCRSYLEGEELPVVEQTVAERIFQMWKSQPTKDVLFCGDEARNGAELSAEVERLAGFLQANGVNRGDRVGIALPQGIAMVTTALAIMAVGGVIVLLDRGAPKTRIARICRDAALRAIVAEENELPGSDGVPVLGLADVSATIPSFTSVAVALGDPAYVIFTSGTTGVPKGVVVGHRAFAAHCLSAEKAYGMQPSDCWLQFAPFMFDAALEQIFPALACGGSVVLRDADLWSAAAWNRRVAESRVTVADVPPLYLRELLIYYQQSGMQPPATLRAIIVGGEALPVAVARQWQRSSLADRLLINAYGPTEAVVTATWHTLQRETQIDGIGGAVAIGTCMPGRVVRILDPSNQQVDVGVYGELCIGGVIAEGYLNRPELTGEKFINTPEGLRLYRTGDRVRLLTDGTIEFAGRMDQQVKIRGFRIEPGEIETVLQGQPGVERACVTTMSTDGAANLIAYVVADEGVSVAALLERLGEELPTYMLPARIVRLDDLPLTPTGTVDPARLPIPDPSSTEGEGTVEFSEQEAFVAGVWCEVLGRAQIPRQLNFFEAGGHSLLLVRLHTLLSQRLHSDIRLVELFRYTTISQQARRIYGHSESEASPVRAAEDNDEAIAIVGMACRFPEAEDPDRFWQNLTAGRCSIAFFSREELLANGTPPELADHPGYVAAHGALEEIDCFDAPFFAISGTEARQLDPQHRQFMQVVWHALEHGGYDPYRYPGRIGVFAGCGMGLYLMENILSAGVLDQSVEGYQISMANDKDFLPTRISYRFNLRGPSVNVNTACSTSLVAVHLACRSLLAGECDMALAGGVSLRLNQKEGYLFQAGSIMSPDGFCRPFAENSGGIVGGSGAGAVLLKRLSRVLEDGDTIQAVIRGSAINNDGNAKVGFSAPSISGQTDVIAQAWQTAGIDPTTIGFVETHGTGTDLGDPVEIEALTEAYSGMSSEQGSCALGAVKANVGHLDTAAGVVGLIKAALAVRHGRIPPTLHCERLNPKIDFAGGPFFVNTTTIDWPLTGVRRAGVSSFGMGGTNAHMVLEQPPQSMPRAAEESVWIVPLSAESQESLSRLEQCFAEFLEGAAALRADDLFYTLAMGRRECRFRQVVVATSRAAARRLLAAGSASPFDGEGLRLTPNASLQRPVSGLAPDRLAQLVAWVNGEAINWPEIFAGNHGQRIPLPLYPFAKKSYWIDKKQTEAAISATGKEPVVRLPLAEWLYIPSWKSTPARIRREAKPLLVLESGTDVEEAVVRSLKGFSCTLAAIGEFTDFGRLFDNLDGALTAYEEIVYLPPVRDLDPAQSRSYCFDLLIALVQALGPRLTAARITLTILARNTVNVLGNETLQVDKSLIFGPLRTIPLEYPSIRCRLIDLDRPDNPLVGDEIGGRCEAPLVGLRNRRWLRNLEPLALPSEETPIRLKQGGVYLITGGTSGIGLTIAQHLAETVQARLALLSRHPLHARDARLAQLVDAGGTVINIGCDVTDRTQIQRAIIEVRGRWGGIDGIIHCAGRGGGRLLPMFDKKQADAIMDAKVEGARHLFAAAGEVQPDFLFFCSSLTGQFGAHGQAAYIAANCYVDTLAEHIRTTTPLFAVSAAWDGWAGTGMAARARRGIDLEQRTRRSLRFTPREYWPMGEHLLDDRPLMVGTGFLNLVAEAIRGDDESGLLLEEVLLVAALSADADKEIVLDIEAAVEPGAGETAPFAVCSRRDGQHQDHVRGRYRRGDFARPQPLSISELEQTFTDRATPPPGQGGISAGPHWQMDNTLFRKENEVFAALRLPREAMDELTAYPWHPALFDRLTACSLLPLADADAFLPVKFGKVVIHAPLTREVYALSRLHLQEVDSMVEADILIMDGDGQVLVEIENYTLMKPLAGQKIPADRQPDTADPFPGIFPAEGKRVFNLLLAQNEPVVAVSSIPLEFQQQLVTHEEPSGEMAHSDLTLVDFLRALFIELIGQEDLQPEDNIFDLGADSLTTLQAASRVNEQFGVELAVDVFFQHPTIRQLAAYLVENYALDQSSREVVEWEEGTI